MANYYPQMIFLATNICIGTSLLKMYQKCIKIIYYPYRKYNT